ncbi:MAG: hypothetical protein HW392_1891 [Steroidobacteraceae bacterium]|nr:hypothetical protein [Steroidobacteraceae bacterium]
MTEALVGPAPGGRAIWYQKHMAHHLLPVMGRAWLDQLTHAFLIREPDEMLASLLRTYPQAGLADTGLPQQWEIFERVAERLGRAPPVVLSSDVLRDPVRCRRGIHGIRALAAETGDAAGIAARIAVRLPALV